MILLNIDLRTSTEHFDDAAFHKGVQLSRQWVLHQVIELLGNDNVEWFEFRFRDSDTETTMILAIDLKFTDAVKACIKDLADTLQQGYITAYDTKTGDGELIGEYVPEWCEFNSDYFLI